MDKKNLIIVILFVSAICLISATYAIYKNEANTTTALASAEWSVQLEQTGVNSNLTVVPEVANATYTLNVKNLSEVDIKYTIVINNLPTGIEVSLNGVDFTRETNGTVTFTNAGTIPYSAAGRVNSNTLTFRGTSSSTFVNNQTVNINVIAEEIIPS